MIRRPLSALRAFITGEAGGGAVLLAATVLAMVAANWSVTAHGYEALLHYRTGPVIAPALGPMTVHLWINDGLMACSSCSSGWRSSASWSTGSSPTRADGGCRCIAAVAGMAVPAPVYLLIVGEYARVGARLGDPGGDRHRLCDRHAGAARIAGHRCRSRSS